MKTEHTTTRNWNVDVLLRNQLQQRPRYDRRHFHQLFASCVSRTRARIGTSSDKILGTSITCSGSGKGRVKKMCEIQQLSHHLRHRIIESRQRDRIDDLLHGAPLCKLLRPDLGEPLKPGGQGGRHIIDVREEDASGNSAVQCNSRSSSPALAMLCPREEWCNFSARATATVIRSCRNTERSRRSLRRRALPVPPSAPSRAAITTSHPLGLCTCLLSLLGNEQQVRTKRLLLMMMMLFLTRAMRWDVLWPQVIEAPPEPSSTHSCERSRGREMGTYPEHRDKCEKGRSAAKKNPATSLKSPHAVDEHI